MVLKSLLLKSNGKLSNAQQNQEDGGRSNGATEPVADDLPRSVPAASKLWTRPQGMRVANSDTKTNVHLYLRQPSPPTHSDHLNHSCGTSD